MKDITKLPDKWCEPAPFMDGAGALSLGYNKGRRDCAMDIISALPKWTKISDDPDTWPPIMNENLPIKGMFVAQPESTAEHEYIPTFTWFDEDDMIGAGDWIGTWWRPLCDLDCPPKDSS